MWIASRFFDSVIINQHKICAEGAARRTFQPGFRVDDGKMSKVFQKLSEDAYFRIVLRAAALFHDIGHGPLSHLFDKFFPLVKEVRPLLSDARYNHVRSYLATMKGADENKPIAHELLSCIIATWVLNDIASLLERYGIRADDMVRDVCAVIKKEIEPSKRMTALDYKVSSLLHDIISSDIDADRMDYLMRDSHMCGVNYGLYDQDRILKSMCAYARVKDRSLHASIRYSGVGALEDLLIARYQMHAQIYGHKTNRACSAMLDAIRDRLKQSSWKWYVGCGSIQALLEKFSALDDQCFINMLLDQGIDNGKGKVREIAEKLFVTRRLVKRLFEVRTRKRCQEPLFPRCFGGRPLSRSVIPSFHRVTLCCTQDSLPNGWPLT
jgi:HD superfamily phosphohydrolase